MATIELLFASPDRDYVERFLRYMRTTVHEYDWKIKSFTDLNLLSQWIASGKRYDLCVIDTLWLQRIMSSTQENHANLTSQDNQTNQAFHDDHDNQTIRLPARFIWLDREARGEIEWNDTSMPVVAKYQSVPTLLTTLLNVRTSEKGSVLPNEEMRDSCVIGIYSTIAGSGKTTLCFHMVKLLRQLNKRPLYVNLELIHAGETFWEAMADDGFGQLLYYIKSGSELVKEKLVQAIHYDATINCDVIPPIKHFNNRQDMDFDDVGKLIRMLRSLETYDYILLDLDSFMHESIQGALHYCDDFYWLITNENSCLHKTNTILSLMDRNVQLNKSLLKQKGSWIINRSSGNLARDRDPLGLPVAGTLPAIPEWSSAKSKEEIIQSEYYTQCLSKFFPPSMALQHDRLKMA